MIRILLTGLMAIGMAGCTSGAMQDARKLRVVVTNDAYVPPAHPETVMTAGPDMDTPESRIPRYARERPLRPVIGATAAAMSTPAPAPANAVPSPSRTAPSPRPEVAAAQAAPVKPATPATPPVSASLATAVSAMVETTAPRVPTARPGGFNPVAARPAALPGFDPTKAP